MGESLQVAAYRLLRVAVAVQFVAAGWRVMTMPGEGPVSWVSAHAPWASSISFAEGALLVALGIALALRATPALLLAGTLWVVADISVAVFFEGGSVLLFASRAVRFAAPCCLLTLMRDRRLTGQIAEGLASRPIFWLRLAAAATFAAHGIGAIAGRPHFVELITATSLRLTGTALSEPFVLKVLLVIGTLDLLLALSLLTTRWQWVPGYMACWAAIAAASRITALGWPGVPEAFLRACNAVVPLAVLLWSLEPRRQPDRAWSWVEFGRPGIAPLLAVALGVAGVVSTASGLPVDAGEDAVVVNLLPEDGATVPARANLCVHATHPAGEAMSLTFLGRDLSVEPAEEFTIVALPDTQVYAQSYPAIFDSQTAWIVEQRQARNIVFVTQLGDLVDTGQSEFEWKIAEKAMGLLENPATTGLPDGIPYGIAVGSHDQGHRSHGTVNSPGWTTTLYNQYFGVDRFQERGYFGGAFGDNNDNNYQLFSASGMDFIAIHLEYERVDILDLPLQEQVLDWADGVLADHPDRRAIVSSHYLLNYFDGSWTPQGEVIYERLKRHPNLFLMLCAHLAGEPRRTDTYQGGTVHTLMADYQFYNNGGDGYLRIHTFVPAQDEIRTVTYSPWLEEFRVNPVDEFTLPYDMQGGRPFEVLGSVDDVSSGSTACLEWPGRRAGADFEWYARVDGARGPVGSFSGDGQCQSEEDCDDADPCTLNRCRGGFCQQVDTAGCCVQNADCDDDNPCTDDTCESMTCVNTANTRPCSDGSACTGGDVCGGGVCSGTTNACDDGNACTLDVCFENACSSDYASAAGCCTMDIQCHDADPCTVDTCDLAGNCRNDPDPQCCTDAAQCDDALACSVDVCSPTNLAAFRVSGNEHITMRPKGYWPVSINTGASTFTLELWFKWDGGGSVAHTSELQDGGLEAYPLVTRGRNDLPNRETNERSVNYFLGIVKDAHVLVGDFEEHDSGSNPGMNHPVTGSTPIAPGEWHHAAATYDGSCWQLFLDGRAETDGGVCPGEPPNFEADAGLNIGSAQDFQGWIEGHFSGLLDEVRVWNRALSQAEIQANMDRQVETHPDLIGRWGLNEVEDLYVADSTGNGQIGVAVGGTWEMLDVLPLNGNRCTTVPPPPPPLTSLIVRDLNGGAELTWAPQGVGTLYDLISGWLTDVLSEGLSPPVVCLADDTASTSYNDSRPVPTGEAAFYLLRATNGCTTGDYGAGLSGTPRTPQGGCP